MYSQICNADVLISLKNSALLLPRKTAFWAGSFYLLTFTGVAFLLGVVTLHQQGAGESALTASHALVALYDRIFVIGQGFMPAIDDLLLGILLYKSRLVPRWLSLIGIIGAFPLFAGYFALMFGLTERTSPVTGASALMVAFFEFTLGIFLLVKGIRKSPSDETNS